MSALVKMTQKSKSRNVFVMYSFPIMIFFLTLSANTIAETETIDKPETVNGISNYVKYNENFASSGQPTVSEFKLVKESGVEQVIYLAFNNNHTAIKDEDRVVIELGMDYIHIPIDFRNPTLRNFQTFLAVMERSPVNTLLHCQVNYRASTFSFLYRVIYLKEPVHVAKEALDSVWEPSPIWFEYIKDVLAHYSIDYDCEQCDWGANDLMNKSSDTTPTKK